MIVFAWAAPAPSPSPGTFYSDVYPLATAYSGLGAPAYYSAPTYAYASPYAYNSYNYAYRAPYTYGYSSSILL